MGKVAVLLEAVVCFGPLALFLGGGVILVPMAAVGEIETSRILLLVWVLAGCVGLFALISTLLAIVSPTPEVKSSKWVLPSYLAGICALIPILFLAEDVFSLEQLLLVAPVVAALHFMYLARVYLFKTDSGGGSISADDA